MAILVLICRLCRGPAYIDDRTPPKRQPICWFCCLAQLKPNEGDKRR